MTITANQLAARHQGIESWHPVSEAPSLYEVSSHGRVRRVGGKVLKLHIKASGYYQTRLSFGSRRDWQWISVHRLVARAFHGPCPEEMQVDHRDGDKLNNTPANLEYVTQHENQRRARALGNWPIGDRNGRAKLSASQAAEIRRSMACSRDLAAKYGIDRTIVQRIRAGRIWKAVRVDNH